MHGYTPLEALCGPGLEAERRFARTFARSMQLFGSPASTEAKGLTDVLLSSVIIPARPAGPSMLAKYRAALQPFLTDLFDAMRFDKWSMLETNTHALRRYPGGATALTTMREALGAAGLLEELPGYVRHYQMFGIAETQRFRTSFRPSEKLLRLAEDHGVDVEDFARHFRPSIPKAPTAPEVLVARATKQNPKERAKSVLVDLQAPKPTAVLSSLQRLNAHLMPPGRIDGIVFAGLRRIFSNADRPDFDWQWHGRYYSMPSADRYEAMSMGDDFPHSGARARAKVIRIDGREVVEVDVSASHLTILHGLLGLPFDPETDPYGLPGVRREDAKEWLTKALGSGDVTKGGNRLSAARYACTARYPFLTGLSAQGITSLDLQYHEAEIMRLAMEDLMDQHGIGFLPVHDALMVAKGNEGLAVQAIRNGFTGHFKRLGLAAPVPRVQ